MNTRRIIALLLAVVCLLQLSFTPTAFASTKGKKAPDFTLKTPDGRSLTLSKLEGKRGVILVFFATWCPACMAEVPQVKTLVDKLKDKNVLVYGINLREQVNTVNDFIKRKDVNYRILLDSTGEVGFKYNVTGIPLVIGIDSDGIVQYREHAVPDDPEVLAKKLTANLKLNEKKNAVKKDELKPVIKDGVSHISKELLQKWQKDGKKLYLVDVLSPESYHKAHIDGSINIPFNQIESLKHKLPKDGRVVVYCASYKCTASTAAAKKLLSLGYTDVHDYKGGIKEWTETKLPTAIGKHEVSFIDKNKLQDLIKNDKSLVIVDVLSPESYAKAHIKGAINIPLEEIEKRADELKKGATIVVYCANYVCHASTAAAEKLSELGFSNVHDYKGGVWEWKKNGLPVVGNEK